MKKNELYVWNSPEHKVLSVVVIDTIPDSKALEVLDAFSEISDLVFLFSDSRFDIAKVDKRKFTNLHKGRAYLDISGTDLGSGTVKILDYFKEVYPGSHLSFTISNLSELKEVEISLMVENITKFMMSSVVAPVFRVERVDIESLREIYTLEGKDEMLESRWKFWKKSKDLEDTFNDDLVFYKHRSPSKILYFSKSVLNLYLHTLEDPKYKGYIESFIPTDKVVNVFANLTKDLGIKNLNYDVEKFDLGKLS